MLIHLQTRPDIAKDIQEHRLEHPESKRLQSLVARFESRLEPMHPGTQDRELTTHFVMPVPEHVDAKEICDALLESGMMEAAYVKPAEGPPA